VLNDFFFLSFKNKFNFIKNYFIAIYTSIISFRLPTKSQIDDFVSNLPYLIDDFVTYLSVYVNDILDPVVEYYYSTRFGMTNP
jgi:hypothetical protein